jgi:hypothetical protein
VRELDESRESHGKPFRERDRQLLPIGVKMTKGQ